MFEREMTLTRLMIFLSFDYFLFLHIMQINLHFAKGNPCLMNELAWNEKILTQTHAQRKTGTTTFISSSSSSFFLLYSWILSNVPLYFCCCCSFTSNKSFLAALFHESYHLFIVVVVVPSLWHIGTMYICMWNANFSKRHWK